MNFENNNVSELINVRQEARLNKDWKLCDDIRNYLDIKQSFVFDTKEGQVVYHELEGMTRDMLVQKINRNKRSEKLFESWLYSMKSGK